MLRLFVAVEIPLEIRTRMYDVVAELKTTDADVRWEGIEKLHITLKFLGNTKEELLPQLAEVLEQVAQRFTPFDVRYGTIGRFPAKGQPRVIWIGVIEGQDVLTSLARVVDERMTGLGFSLEERPFHPHVTLGRVKGSRNIPLLLRSMESLTFESERTRVDQFSLMKSELKPSGSVYTLLNRFPVRNAETRVP